MKESLFLSHPNMISHLEIHESIDDNDNRNMSSTFIENSIGFAFVYKHVPWSFDQNCNSPFPPFHNYINIMQQHPPKNTPPRKQSSEWQTWYQLWGSRGEWKTIATAVRNVCVQDFIIVTFAWHDWNFLPGVACR